MWNVAILLSQLRNWCVLWQGRSGFGSEKHPPDCSTSPFSLPRHQRSRHQSERTTTTYSIMQSAILAIQILGIAVFNAVDAEERGFCWRTGGADLPPPPKPLSPSFSSNSTARLSPLTTRTNTISHTITTRSERRIRLSLSRSNPSPLAKTNHYKSSRVIVKAVSPSLSSSCPLLHRWLYMPSTRISHIYHRVSFRTLISGVLPLRGAHTGPNIIKLWSLWLFCVCLCGLVVKSGGGWCSEASSFAEFCPCEWGMGWGVGRFRSWGKKPQTKRPQKWQYGFQSRLVWWFKVHKST